MGIINSLMHYMMSKEAKRMAKEFHKFYLEIKEEFPNLSEREIILRTYFDPNVIETLPEKSRKRILKCCETANGICYMLVLDTGKFKKFINLRSLQFTRYMDAELEKLDFPKITKEQKERIIDVMGLKIKNWERIAL